MALLGKNGEEKRVRARIDTGATFSSIDSRLAADLELESSTKSKVIKSASGTKKRPVVYARIRMEGLVLNAEFSLADRGHMTYPLLVGQNILRKGNFLIDPNRGGKP